jgi:hypothetical protein
MVTDLKNMFWLEEELAGAPPQVEGGGGKVRQLAHIAQARSAHLQHRANVSDPGSGFNQVSGHASGSMRVKWHTKIGKN